MGGSEKQRFEGRLKSLHKKAYELSTLCDINVSVIAYSDNESSQPLVWPDHSVALTMCKEHLSLSLSHHHQNLARKRTTTTRDFVESDSNDNKNKKKKVESTDQSLMINNLSQQELRDLRTKLDEKIRLAKARLGFLAAQATPETQKIFDSSFTQLLEPNVDEEDLFSGSGFVADSDTYTSANTTSSPMVCDPTFGVSDMDDNLILDNVMLYDPSFGVSDMENYALDDS